MIHALLVAALLVPPESARPPQDPAPAAGQPATAPTQEPPPPPAPVPPEEARPEGLAKAPARAPRTQMLDAVLLIINDHCITYGDLQRRLAQEGKPPASEEEYRRMLSESADDLTRQQLMQQAGRDLGYDEKMIQSAVHKEMERQREAYGSVAALAEDLDRFSFDSLQLKGDTEDKIYRDLWKGQVTGVYAGPGGRPYVDRYVRPGQIQLEFERKGSSLDLPATVQLEEMIIAPDLGETPESARQRAQLVRSRLRNGEDFYELNATFGIPGRDPELKPIEESKLGYLPDVKDFVDGASPGDVSDPFPIVQQGQLAGFRILRFVGRQEGKAASFIDRQFQSQLASEVLERREQLWQARALRRLKEAAYIWPPELASQGGAGQEPEAAPGQPAEPAEEPPAQVPTGPAGTPPAGSAGGGA